MSRETVERNVKREGRGMWRETVERNVKREGREECQERQ